MYIFVVCIWPTIARDDCGYKTFIFQFNPSINWLYSKVRFVNKVLLEFHMNIKRDIDWFQWRTFSIVRTLNTYSSEGQYSGKFTS